ncbi:Na/Pi-cotransporter [Brevibacillus laterosporus]|nr:Na/Pi-cotransporter [Brevibacillus laterosporus]MDF9412750.1 Na/Pi cotransporter family protein [Brevibacillus laterosporus]
MGGIELSMLYHILLPFFMGLSFFLLGLYAMRIGFNQLAGRRMELIITRFTRSTTHSFFSGLFSTFVLQSSTAVTVLTIGLTQAGIIGFSQTIGIILGTNVGSTITTELIALHLEDLAVPMLLIGVAMWLQPKRRSKAIGLIIGGFGLIFLGIDTMQVIAKPLENSQTFRTLFLESKHSLWIGLLTGTVFSALVHSSAATTAITMTLISYGVFSMDTAISIVLGGNIGTCITAIIASIGTNTASKQVAWCHTLFNVVGGLVFLPFVSMLAYLAGLLTTNPSMQIAHAQTIFNLLCSVIALPFASSIAKGIQWLIPEHK